MILENLSIEGETITSFYLKLNDIDKLNIAAIIFEHINYELINDGNFLNSDEAIENDKEVLLLTEVCQNNPLLMAILFYASAKYKNNEEPLIPLQIEPYLKKNRNINKCLTLFYKLSYIDKLNFIMEMLYDTKNLILLKHTVDINGTINNILNYRNTLIKSIQTNNPLED